MSGASHHGRYPCSRFKCRLDASVHACVPKADVAALVKIAVAERTTVSAVVRRALAREIKKSAV